MLKCEIVKNTLPALRSFIAKELIYDYKLNQSQTAKLLGVTQSAISQYLNDKRGGKRIRKLDEVKKSCKRIYDKEANLDEELCRLCRIIAE